MMCRIVHESLHVVLSSKGRYCPLKVGIKIACRIIQQIFDFNVEVTVKLIKIK